MAATPGARGVILHAAITEPSNYRSTRHLDAWLKARGIIGLCGIDTRALTALIREKGMPNAVIAHSRAANSTSHALKEEAPRLARPRRHGPRAAWSPPASAMSGTRRRGRWGEGFGRQTRARVQRRRDRLRRQAQHPAPAGRAPAARSPWCRRPPSAEDILALKPDGVFLSNGPGDPAATGEYAVPVIKDAGRLRHADLRHLPRPPDAGPRARRQDREDASGPSRRQPSGQGPHHRQGRDHLDEPRLRGRHGDAARRRRRRPTSRCSTVELRHRARPTSRCSPCSITRKPRPARATATICSSASSS